MKVTDIDYARQYIKRALTDVQIDEPNRAKAHGTYEALYGLFMAHQVNGPDGAKMAWSTLKKIRPELGDYEAGPLLIHADELKNLSIPTYLLSSYPIYAKCFNVLVGKSGSGKSFTALDIAGRVASDGCAIYIAGEGVSGYAARWESWKKYHHVATAELYFYCEALQVMDEADLYSFVQMLEKHQPTLVIIDTMARSAVGLDENSAKDVGQFIAATDRLRSALDCAVLVVHHTGKSGDMRGSSALYGAADAVITQSLNDGLIKVTNNPDFGGKNKFSASDFESYFRIVPFSAEGFQGAVLTPAELVITNPALYKLTNYQKEILETIDGYQEGLTAKAIIEATEIKQATVYRNLKRLMQAEYINYAEERYTITASGETVLQSNEDAQQEVAT